MPDIYLHRAGMYKTLYGMSKDMVRMMGFFSEELRMMDKDTVQYMIDEQQKIIDQNRVRLEEKEKTIESQQAKLEENQAAIEELQALIKEQNQFIEQLQQKKE